MHQVLIQWKDGGPETTTWEDIATIKYQFPDFNLENKVVLLGEGSIVSCEEGNITPRSCTVFGLFSNQ